MKTDDKRDEIRRQQNKPWYVKCPWFETELGKALDEIDEQAVWFAERADDPKLFREEVEQIERRTKEAVWEAIRPMLPATSHTLFQRVKQAIDSAEVAP